MLFHEAVYTSASALLEGPSGSDLGIVAKSRRFPIALERELAWPSSIIRSCLRFRFTTSKPTHRDLVVASAAPTESTSAFPAQSSLALITPAARRRLSIIWSSAWKKWRLKRCPRPQFWPR